MLKLVFISLLSYKYYKRAFRARSLEGFMNRDVIKQVIIDQREMFTGVPIVHRMYEFEDGVNYCFVGIRRAGKSYYMYQRIRELLEQGIPQNEIIYVNFEDERLMEMTADDLNLILEIGYELSGGTKPHIFLDEIQNIDGWSRFARRIADQKHCVCITGSNFKMLSSEIASALGGCLVITDSEKAELHVDDIEIAVIPA